MAGLAALVALGVVPASSLAAGEVVDRIVAIVDREAITLSEAEQALQLRIVRGGDEDSPLAEVVERLIEALLIEREVARYPGEALDADQVEGALAAVRESFPSEGDYREALESQGMTEEALHALVSRQLAINRYLERRFRALVRVSDEELRRYYDDELLPVLRETAEPAPPVESVAESIRRILRERKFNQRIESWIEELKTRAHIRRYVW